MFSQVATLVAVLVMEEEEEAMEEEALDMATRVGAMEVVMTTMEEVTLRLKTFKHFSYKLLQVIRGWGEGYLCMLCKEAVIFHVV